MAVRRRIRQHPGAERSSGLGCELVRRDYGDGLNGGDRGGRADGVDQHGQHHASRVAAENTGASLVLAAVSRFTAITSPTSRPRMSSCRSCAPSCQQGRPARVKAWSRRRCWGPVRGGRHWPKSWADAGNEVRLLGPPRRVADEINDTHRNTSYLGDRPNPKSIHATSDPAEALSGACTVLLAVPAQTLRANLVQWAPLISNDTTLVSLAKGIELDTLMRMSQVIVQVTGVDPSRVAVISGPNLASEIADRQPTATVIACTDQDGRSRCSSHCSPPISARTPSPT